MEELYEHLVPYNSHVMAAIISKLTSLHSAQTEFAKNKSDSTLWEPILDDIDTSIIVFGEPSSKIRLCQVEFTSEVVIPYIQAQSTLIDEKICTQIRNLLQLCREEYPSYILVPWPILEAMDDLVQNAYITNEVESVTLKTCIEKAASKQWKKILQDNKKFFKSAETSLSSSKFSCHYAKFSSDGKLGRLLIYNTFITYDYISCNI